MSTHRADLIGAAAADGLTHVRTSGGLVRLADFFGEIASYEPAAPGGGARFCAPWVDTGPHLARGVFPLARWQEMPTTWAVIVPGGGRVTA
jgi:hypothetical protein